jgi:Domain of unknown function (DUF4041)/T5orf172 domain/Protein of unknown function (DUF2510)
VVAPGWFADPHHPAVLRWWDGQAWTEHTTPVPVEALSNGQAAQRSHEASPRATQQSHAQPTAGAPSTAAANEKALQATIAAAESHLQELQQQLESVEEALEIQSFGFYRPRYGFESSEEYVMRLKELRESQKETIRSGQAARCDREWKVGGSVKEGKKMIDRIAKLMLRAFNGDCDAAIAKARYDNVVSLEQRITKAWEEVNKLGESNVVTITKLYYEQKLAELHLVHEHREKVQAEKEEQKRVREQLREEQKAREEIERAQADAERDEDHNRRALEKAQAELAASAATDQQHTKLEGLVARLENELKDALDRKAKAIARAQLTRSGHVYILSNVGSFGEGIFKIGLTRRLDPYERVDELGSAAVPFRFDVHAIIFAEDAPALEHALHTEFTDRRVNLANPRREYFRVSLDKIRAAVDKHHGLVSFVLTPEAEEWRKTQAMRAVVHEGGSHAG